MTPWIEDRARVRCEDLEHKVIHLREIGQPVQARAAMGSAMLLRALFEEGVA